MNRFVNINAEPWYRWIFRRHDQLRGITVYFLSAKNSTSARFFPLYENTKKFRIVVIKGFRIGQLDNISLLFYRLFCKTFAKKLSAYDWVAPTNFRDAKYLNSNLLINVDDPTYDEIEKGNLLYLLEMQEAKKKNIKFVVTNVYTKSEFSRFLPEDLIEVLPQGCNPLNSSTNKYSFFSLVYTSPYIDYIGDKHETHESWSAVHLIDELIPLIISRIPGIRIHLIGRLGEKASREILKFPQVLAHGLVGISENKELISRCHLGIYPRLRDSKRSVMKIFDYAGSGLPVVSYKLIDTTVVDEQKWGISVSTSKEFVDAIELLARSEKYYMIFVENIKRSIGEYSWENIAANYDSLIG
jgi:glycosyltransferase involved in cell wall biosynthesis